METYFSYFLTQTYVVSNQKNNLNLMVLLSTQNRRFNCWVRKGIIIATIMCFLDLLTLLNSPVYQEFNTLYMVVLGCFV